MRLAVSARSPLPTTSLARRQILGMIDRKELRPLMECNGVYRVTVPFASLLPCPDEFVVQECCPTSFLAYSNALHYHRLTFEIPRSLSFVMASSSSLIPIGTTPDDWIDIPSPPRRKPATINDREIRWHQLRGDDMPGVSVGFIDGLPVYVTDLERTLIDALRFPDSCGGLTRVFEAWRHATDRLNVNRLVQYATTFNTKLMYQRIGFVLDEVGIDHPSLDEWADNASRGSSAKLVASREFSSTYSERWCLSINVTPSELAALKE